MITDQWLEKERINEIGGVQRLYKFKSGYKLSAINAKIAHAYPYAWEFAVIGLDDNLDYSTELTSDVYVTFTEDEANQFILKAAMTIGGES